MRTSIAIVLFLFFFTLSNLASAEPSGFRSYQLAQHGSLQLGVPRSWNDQLKQRKNGLPPTILFAPEKGNGFTIEVTPLWPTKVNAVMPNKEEIHDKVAKVADDSKAQTVETTIPIQEIQGASGSGFYFTATDRAPNPDEFKTMTEGLLPVGELMVSFTILSNDGAEAAVADALKMLKDARQVKAEKR